MALKKMPKMAPSKRLEVLSMFDGGINLSVLPQLAADNESPDMLNLWKQGGVLRLRPGLRKLVEHDYGGIVEVYPKDRRKILLSRVTKNGSVLSEKYGIYIVTERAVLSYDGSDIEKIADEYTFEDDWVKKYVQRNFKKCVMISSGSENMSTLTSGDDTWTAEGEAVYIIGSGYYLVVMPKVICYEKPTGTPHITSGCIVQDIPAHVPVLFENCTPEGVGTKVEERNLLSKRRIQKFTTNHTATVYKFCESDLDKDTVTAVYYADWGSVYTFNFPKGYSISIQNGIVGELSRTKGTITFSYPLVDAASLGLVNNLVVTYSKTYEEVPVKNCTLGTWYDGGTQTGSGCGRMFLSGDPNAPNRIYYSSTNDPSYFAENAYIDIGASADPVKAFGIQFDILVIFKEHSVYSLKYADETGTPAFTVKIVNAGAGCDMPGTLLLVSNMLVWANSSGGVFALLSTTVKDERAVRLLSQNINSKLLSLPVEDLMNATAVCDGSSYFLLVGDKAFILSCDTLHFSADKKPEDAPWFIWHLPRKFTSVIMYGNYFAVVAPDGTIYIFDDNATEDCGEWYDAWWYSKSFDFNKTGTLKRPYRITVGVGSEGPLNLEVFYRDSAGETHWQVPVTGSEFYKTISINPPSVWSQYVSFGIRRAKENTAFQLFGYSIEAVSGARCR